MPQKIFFTSLNTTAWKIIYDNPAQYNEINIIKNNNPTYLLL
jgi:hypothetical protein